MDMNGIMKVVMRRELGVLSAKMTRIGDDGSLVMDLEFDEPRSHVGSAEFYAAISREYFDVAKVTLSIATDENGQIHRQLTVTPRHPQPEMFLVDLTRAFVTLAQKYLPKDEG